MKSRITWKILIMAFKKCILIFEFWLIIEIFEAPERVISKETWRMVIEDSLIAVEDSSLSSLVAADQEALLEVIG